MKNNNFILIGVIALLVLGGGAYLTSMNSSMPSSDAVMEAKKPAGSSTNMMVESATGASDAGQMAPSTTKSFTVSGNNFAFDVKEMKVKKGDTVSVTFKNAEGFHDWVLDEFNAKTKQIKANEEETITFVADKVGTFEYYCSVGQHRANGMVGKLIVEE